MDQVVRGALSFGSLLWQGLGRAVALLRVLHGQIRLVLDAMHVPHALDGGIIALLWVVVLVSSFRALPIWGRFVLVFCTSAMLAKIYGGAAIP